MKILIKCHVSLLDVMYHYWMSCIIIGCHVLLLDVMYYYWMSCIIIECHVLLLDVMYYYWMSCIIIRCHVLFIIGMFLLIYPILTQLIHIVSSRYMYMYIRIPLNYRLGAASYSC